MSFGEDRGIHLIEQTNGRSAQKQIKSCGAISTHRMFQQNQRQYL